MGRRLGGVLAGGVDEAVAASADSFYNRSFDLVPITAAKVKLVARNPNSNGIASLPLAGNIPLGRTAFILPGINHSLNVHDDSAAQAPQRGFAKYFGFGLIAIFGIKPLGRS
jgi:hypothetical protein